MPSSETRQAALLDIAENIRRAQGFIYRHNYEDVQQQLVWSTIHEHLPQLLAAVEAEIARGE